MPFGKSDNIDGPIAFSPTSLSDTLVTSFEAANQETSMSVVTAKRDAYDRYISVLRENGLNPPTSPYKRPIDEFSDSEDAAIANWHRDVDALIHPSSQLQSKSHADLLEDAAAEREKVRQRREQAALGESGFLSGAAAFTGSMAGATADPLVIGTLPIGAPWATGILRTVLLEAAIGGVSEVGVQGLFQTQRQELGEESSIAEAAANIGLAAAGAGVLGGTIKGGVKGVQAARRLYLDRQQAILEASRSLPDELRTTEVRTAEDILERELEAEAINPLEGEAGRAEHMSRMAQAEQLMATDQPVDLGPPASPTKPLPEIRPPSDDVNTVVSANFTSGRVIGNETVDIDTLFGGVSDDVAEQARVQELADIIASEEGFVSRLIVDTQGNVIEGQHRLEALRLLGIREVPIVRVADVTESLPVQSLEDAINDVGGLHSDNVNRLISDLADMLADPDVKRPRDIFEEYEISSDLEKYYEAAVKVLEANGIKGPAPVSDVSSALDPILERTIALGREVRESIESGKPVNRAVPFMEEPPTPEERLIGSPEEEIEVIDLEVEAELQRMLAEEADTRVHLGDADNLQETTIRDAAERLDNEAADLETIRLCGAF